MYNEIVTVKEQKPTGNSIYCEVYLKDGNSETTFRGQMYFVCNLDKQITQYFEWQKREIKQGLKKLGYKF